MDRVGWAKILQKDGYAIRLGRGTFTHGELFPTKNYILMDFNGEDLKAVPVYPIWRHCFNDSVNVVMYDKSDGRSVEKDFVPLQNKDVYLFVPDIKICDNNIMYCYANLDRLFPIMIDDLVGKCVIGLNYVCNKTVQSIWSHSIVQPQRELKLPDYVSNVIYDDNEYEL